MGFKKLSVVFQTSPVRGAA